MNAAAILHRFLAAPAMAVLAGSACAFETVVIDPGHGGNDDGTRWWKISEKELTLSLARRLEKLLAEKGIHVVLTRYRDSYVSLDERAETANRHPHSLLLSIHFNGSRLSAIKGFEVFAFRESPTGRRVAESLQQAMDERRVGRNRGLRTDQDYAVLVRTNGPAVLVECGFISNKTESARLSTPEGLQKLAEALALGLMRIKPLINFDPPECDLAKCEIYARKFEEERKAERAAARKVADTDARSRNNGKARPKPKDG